MLGPELFYLNIPSIQFLQFLRSHQTQPDLLVRAVCKATPAAEARPLIHIIFQLPSPDKKADELQAKDKPDETAQDPAAFAELDPDGSRFGE
jgi:hypothetical protein